MKSKINLRIIAAVIVFLMVVQILPISLQVSSAEVTEVTQAHNFTTDGIESSFYSITGNLSTSKGSVTYGDLTLTQCLKMESSTSITFTAPADGSLTLVFGGNDSASGKKIKIDGEKTTIYDTQILTVSVTAGEHTITKGDSINLFYMVYSYTAESTGDDTTGDDATDDETTGGDSDATTGTTYVLDAADLAPMSTANKADGTEEVVGTNGYFTVIYSSKTKVDSSSGKDFDDGYTGTQRLNFQAKTATTNMCPSVKFTTASASTVKIWWASGGDGRTFAIYDDTGTKLTTTTGDSVKNAAYISTLTVDAAGTYYLGVPEGSNYLFKLEVTETASTSDDTSDDDTTVTTVTSWDFTADEYTGQTEYNGVTLASSNTISKKDSNYGLAINNGTITIPVYGSCTIKVGVGYQWDITFPDGTNEAVTSGNGGMTTLSYNYTGDAGTVTITVGASCTSYIPKIELVDLEVEEEPATSWDFTADEYTGQTSYHGLTLASSNTISKKDSNYGLAINNGTITVPVPGACTIKVDVGYQWDITFPDGTNEAVTSGNGGMTTLSYDYTGDAGTVEITVGASCTSYIAKIELAELAADDTGDKDDTETPEFDTSKIYVWDFGAEQLDTETYINMLTVDEINSWFPGVEAGTTGKNLASFTTSDGQLSFNDGGYTSTHRLRVKNSGITCYDTGKYLQGADGTVYTGYIYSNKSASADVYISIQAQAGDILTFVLCSNGTEYTAVLEAPSGATQSATKSPSDSKDAAVVTFYATETGTYKLYYTQEKLVVARIYRESTNTVTVTGTVTAPAALTGYSLVFTNTASGAETTAAVENGSYSVSLNDNYTYEVSLADANGYIITGTKSLTIAKGAGSASLDLTVEKVSMATITGSITGLSEDALKNLTLSLVSDAIYVPEVAISGYTYTVNVEIGQEYTLVAAGVNDYAITSATTLQYTENTTADITFAAKPTYAVTIVPNGCTLSDLANATFTFTNLNEAGYVYTFTGTDNITLRDGTYTVTVTGSGYVQKLTSNLTVNGAAVSKTIGFEIPTSWDFRVNEYTGQSSYNGLTITNGSKHGSSYGMSITGGTIVIPVSGPCQIIVSVGYSWDITDGTTTYSDNTNSGDINATFSYSGSAGTVTISTGSSFTSYIKKIEIIASVAYKETITVGATGCDYTTINDALDAIRAMDRTDDQRVTVEIQPGNYEEMLVVDVPNVTLKNASSNPSIDLTNQGVGIAENAVRITWYYGHGYNYYSMGSDYKYDADVLAVNKENGYVSTENPGAGTYTYWNASVVIAADGFRAEGIIFENSFNQYVSEMAANDVLVATSAAKEGTTPRADLTAGSVLVQDKAYVERATALAITDGCSEVYFENCKFVGRQDTLYGGYNATVAFYDCSIYGSTDYIFGGMTAVFAKCDLVFNTSDNSNDIGYITAAQQKNTHGFLMYNCTVTSTTPGVDTASTYESKPGYFGRPWTANTGEAVFYNTVIDATCNHWYDISASLIRADGWLATLSGESALCGEYGTYEYAKDVDNSTNRVAWAAVFTTESLASGEPIAIKTFLGGWDAFAGKDLTIVTPSGKVDNSTAPDDGNDDNTDDDTDKDYTYVEKDYILDATKDLTAFTSGTKANGEEEVAGTDGYFTVIYSEKTKVDSSSKTFDDGYSGTQRLNFQVSTSTETMYPSVKFTTSGASTVKIWWVSGGDGRQFSICNENGDVITSTTGASVKNEKYISTLELEEAGTYYLCVLNNSNNLFKLQVTDLVKQEVSGDDTTDDDNTDEEEDLPYVLDVSQDLDVFATGDKTDGATVVINDYFTIHFSAKSKVEEKSKTFSDGYVSSKRLSLGGSTDVTNGMLNSIEFTTKTSASIKLWWVGGGEGRYIAIYDAKGNIVASTELCAEKDDLHISELTVPAGGTYYIGLPDNNNYLFRVEVLETEINNVPTTGDNTAISLAVALLVISATTVAILPRKKFF